MSGGHFEYHDQHLGYIAEQIGDLVDTNDSQEINEWGDQRGHGYASETVGILKATKDLLELVSVYVHRIDWLVSGDDSEESFHSRLAQDLASLDAKRTTK